MAAKKRNRNSQEKQNKWRVLYKRYETLIAALLAAGMLLVVALALNGGSTASRSASSDESGKPAASAEATVITLNGDGAEISDDGAEWRDGGVYITEAGSYELSGTLADGQVVVDADSAAEVRLLLSGAELYCADDACLRVENAGGVFLTLAGETENRMESGALSAEAGGTIFTRGDLTVDGEGMLEIVSNDRHGVDARGSLTLASGEITVTAAADGLHAGADLSVAGGDLAVVTCSRGLEAQRVEVAGGSVALYPTDDGIYANGADADGDVYIRISDGEIIIAGNGEAQNMNGLASDGSIYVTGGTTFVSMSGGKGNAAVNCDGENGVVEISGGFVIPMGGVSMLAAGQSLFPDVEGRWMEPGADFVALHGIFKGSADGSFAPEGAMTRSALVSALYNFAREQGNEYDASGFTDVEDFRWYANAAGWAKELGILDAKPDGSFGANDAVTREDAADVLYRYARVIGLDTAEQADLSQFADESAVSGQALDAMRWAVEKELLTGKKDGTLDPKGILTRAEMATIFVQFAVAAASA